MIDIYLQLHRPWDQVYLHSPSLHTIYLGDLQAAQNLNFLHSNEITTVITCALGMDQINYSSLDVCHLTYPILDHQHQSNFKVFEEFYDLIEKQILKGNVLIHCFTGISRSATLMASYLMKKQGMNLQQAIRLIKKKRPKIQPSLGLQQQLKGYEGQLKNMLTTRQYSISSHKKRSLSHLKYPQTEELSIQQMKSSLLATLDHYRPSNHTACNKLQSQVRKGRMRGFQSHQKIQQLTFEKRQSYGLLNFEVRKMPMSSRVPHRSLPRSKF